MKSHVNYSSSIEFLNNEEHYICDQCIVKYKVENFTAFEFDSNEDYAGFFCGSCDDEIEPTPAI